ncbi:MAG: haloacid dehalogenase [SAR202 cluster bacterium]|nr:haloacid dehalogenase [SAR202 cluster bacterium]
MADHSARLAQITNGALELFTEKHRVRERVIVLSREVIRHSANAIRAVQRTELDQAGEILHEARVRLREAQALLVNHPDLNYTGYSQDAQKEYAEACCVLAFIGGGQLPLPDEIGVDVASYLNGLAEAASELRRYILDSLRRDQDEHCEELLGVMDGVYNLLVVMDFPDALTNNLRRTTDQLRGVLERTRGDLTMALRQRRLERLLAQHEP